MSQVYEYVPLETLLDRLGRIYGANGEIIRLKRNYIVKLSSKHVPADKLTVNVWFRDGKHQHVNVDARQLSIQDSRKIAGLLNAAENIIRRHEYHERMKAGDT